MVVISAFVVVSTIGLLLLGKRSVFQRSSCIGGGDNGNGNCNGNGNGNITYNTVVKEIEIEEVQERKEPHHLNLQAENGMERKREDDERVLESEERLLRGEVLLTVRVERLAREEVEREGRRRRRVEGIVREIDVEEGFVQPGEVAREGREEAVRPTFRARMVRGMYWEVGGAEEGGR